MKKALLLLFLCSVTYGTIDKTGIKFDTVQPPEMLRKTLYTMIDNIQAEINASGGVWNHIGTGNIYFVDSGAGSDSYGGTSVARAKATIDAAIGLCTANNGDVIVIIQAHAENCASAAAINCDVAGVTIIGLGNGDDMPEIALTAQASTVQIAAADVLIYGIRFLGNFTNGVTEGVDVTANGDGAIIMGCEFRETSNTKELLKMITLTANADRCMILNNRFLGEAGGTDSSAIFLEGGSDKTIIAGNTFIGDWSTNVIDGTTALSTELVIANNYVHNADTSAGKTIQFHASTTGGIFGNQLYGNGSSYAIVADAMFVSPDNVCIQVENVETAITYYDVMQTILADTAAADTEAEVADLGSTLVDNIVEAMDANGLLVNLTAARAGYLDNINNALLLELGLSEIGDKVQVDIDANSLLANLTAARAGYLDNINNALLLELGLSEIGDKVQVDIDANSLLANLTAARAGYLDNINNALLLELGLSEIGDKVVADMDANSLGYWQPRTISWNETLFVSDDAFIVAGGPIMITSMVGIVTTAYDGAYTRTWWCDATTATQDVEFTDSVDIDAYLVGSRIFYSNANPALHTNIAGAGANLGSTVLQNPWFCPVGTIEVLVEGPAAAAGAITWYMTWYPLASGVTVTAQ